MCEDGDAQTDEQDYQDAAEVLERLRKGEEKTYTSAEARKELGIEIQQNYTNPRSKRWTSPTRG